MLIALLLSQICPHKRIHTIDKSICPIVHIDHNTTIHSKWSNPQLFSSNARGWSVELQSRMVLYNSQKCINDLKMLLFEQSFLNPSHQPISHSYLHETLLSTNSDSPINNPSAISYPCKLFAISMCIHEVSFPNSRNRAAASSH